jgi:phosphatidylinositol alpha-mannosyltransferase
VAGVAFLVPSTTSRPLRIGLLGENYFPTLGGIQEHIHHVARQLLARGHQVKVLTGMPEIPWQGPRDEAWVSRVGRARRVGLMGTRTSVTLGPRVAWNLRQILRRERFDVVHVHGPCDVGLPTLLYANYRGPVVATLHSPMNGRSPFRRLLAPYYRYVLGRRSDAVICVSEAARTAMARYADFASTIIPNGIDAAAFARGRPLPRFQDGRTNILMLGRLEPRNGPDLMLSALPQVLALRPDVRLLIAGEGKHGTADYEMAVPPALRDRVVFLGPVYQERADVYASARLCVVPARAGTFSIIVLEALASGVPVVATPFVASWRTEPHFAPVHMSPDFAPETLAQTILGALAEDPRTRIASGQAVARTFDWKHVVDRIEEVYANVCGAGASDAREDDAAEPSPALRRSAR